MIILTIIGLILLGNWQLRRLDWKLSLIERTESRVHSEPVKAPQKPFWTKINAEDHEYLRVTAHGEYLHEKETLIWAATELGNGYWVLTPLITDVGSTVLINRGFVPIDAANKEQRKASLVTGKVNITGLLRLSESGGIFLRDNDPENNHWYSRNVETIAKARNLLNPAPYFIDADVTANPGGLPIGGMTRINFRNPHLFYAVTWYALALLLAIMTLYASRSERVR